MLVEADGPAYANQGIMIALIPSHTEWCRQDTPHMTLVYAGLIEDHSASAFNELAKDASALAMTNQPLTLRTKGLEVFGDGSEDSPKVDVILLEPNPELLAMRRLVEKWDASEYPFRPHVTIGPQGSFVDTPPTTIKFNSVMVGWGDEQLTFWFKKAGF